MCGLIGFFNGCDLKVTCPKAASGICEKSRRRFPSAFKSWDNEASVRSEQNRVPSIENFLFPEAFVPILRSNALREASPDTKKALRAATLFRFLNFTHKLELPVVSLLMFAFELASISLHLNPPPLSNFKVLSTPN